MKRAGFTMIELMFIIVMIGILAAVAIPRLAVSRNDACYAKLRTNLSEAQSELAREYTKRFMQGKTMSDQDKRDILNDTLVAHTQTGCEFVVNSLTDIKMNVGNGNKKETLDLKLEADARTKAPTITCKTNDDKCKKLMGVKGKKTKTN